MRYKEQEGPSDGELLRRAQQGDAKAFEAIYQRYHARLYRVLYGITGNPDDAAELTQEVFIRAYKELSRLRTDGNLYGWLRTTATHLGIDLIRRRNTVRFDSLDATRANEEGEPLAFEIEDESNNPHTLLEERSLKEAIQKALTYLTPEHRTVVTMHYLEEMPVEEIAQLLGVPAGTIKSRLARAREALRRSLASYVEG